MPKQHRKLKMKPLIKQATATGEVHGMIDQLPNSVPFNDFKDASPENKEKLRKQLAHRKKLVKGRYINYRNQMERLEKTYCAGPGEPLQIWRLIPEQTYDLPMGFIEEVNESFMPVRADLVSVDGVNVNQDESPLKQDRFERVHEIVPVGF